MERQRLDKQSCNTILQNETGFRLDTEEQFWSREQFTKPGFSKDQEEKEQVQAKTIFLHYYFWE